MSVTATGIEILTLAQALQANNDRILSLISPYANVLPSAILGQISQITAEGQSQVNELAEEVYNSTALTGSGVSLELSAAVMGKTRELATYGYIIDYDVVTSGAATIPVGFQVTDEDSTVIFETRIAYTLAAAGTHQIKVYSTTAGVVSANTDTINEMVASPPVNVTSVSNSSTSTLINGTATETDAELRARIQNNHFISLSKAANGIRNNVLSANDSLSATANSTIIGCRVVENDSHVYDTEGRPPSSVEVVVYYPQVSGSYDSETDAQVLQKIAESVGDGIQSVSTTTLSFSDTVDIDTNTERVVTASRADAVEIYIEVKTLPNLTADQKTDLKSWLSDWINAKNLGDDIVVYGADSLSNRLNTFTGADLTDYTIKIGRTIPVTTDDNIELTYKEIATSLVSDIDILDLP